MSLADGDYLAFALRLTVRRLCRSHQYQRQPRTKSRTAAFFIVRAGQQSKRAPLVLIVTTATWVAYNDWGGSNAYEGIDGEASDQFSPTLSLERPWSKGLIWLPEGAPRIPNRLLPNSVPRYPNIEFAFSQGFAKYYAASGWATYERNFVC